MTALAALAATPTLADTPPVHAPFRDAPNFVAKSLFCRHPPLELFRCFSAACPLPLLVD
jgi:hypothetical protein